MKKYSLGLDIGTNSIGWAVVDENNKIVKKNNFALWGVRMFDDAQSAKERRQYRSQRRRLQRRKQRLNWLQNEFFDEINKIDHSFFRRLEDSFFKIEDREYKNKYTYFDDEKLEKEYFKKYPTIYHLRKALIEEDKKFDIRMVYLAMHHIIKYRGNFLTEETNYNKDDITRIKNIFDELNAALEEGRLMYEDDEKYFSSIQIEDGFYTKLNEIMLKSISKRDKKQELLKLFCVENKSLVNDFVIPLLVGSKVTPNTFSFVKDMKYEKCEIDLSSEELESKIDEAKKNVPELEFFLDYTLAIKEIVDYYYLLEILGKHSYISEAMVDCYDCHKEELNELKQFVKKYIPKKYNAIFRYNKDLQNNYPCYIGMDSTNGKMIRFNHCKRDDFYKFLKSIIDTIKIEDEEFLNTKNEIYRKIDENKYLLRQNSGQNTAIPMQLNLQELQIILDKQSKYYPFLNESDGKYTRKERIISIFKYHLPYYVGPLNSNSPYSWVKRTDEKITPWNYKEVIKLDDTAKEFIQRMQNKCTYLHGENDYCLPKKSLLFSEYNCLQYLNRLTINGQLIDKNMKDKIFEEVFLKNKKPTRKMIETFLKVNYNYEPLEFTSKIEEVTCDMSSFIQFKEIFGTKFDESKDIIEEIIKDITIFEDKKILEKRLREIYHLDESKIKVIKGLNYKGYATLSKHLLAEFTSENKETGEIYGPIIQIMRDENINLQQILNDQRFNFLEAIDKYNKEQMKDDYSVEEYIEENLYVSPIMRRSLLQSYKLIEEIEHILKHKIDYYYVECTRTNQAQKGPTKSRYEQLKSYYSVCKQQAKELQKFNIDINKLSESLESHKDNLRWEALYLYYTQLGKCLYTLKDIDIDKISKGFFDIDHIYPQSIIKDDSFSNLVLSDSEFNRHVKSDKFLFEINNFLKPEGKALYNKLLDLQLISKEKYRRLTQTSMTSTELDGFVNRQMVATNQAVKGLIELLKQYKGVKPTHIIYSKSENITEFRQIYSLVKSREANNYHHAHDAYLNAVVGRILNQYYEKNHFYNEKDLAKMKNERRTINPSRLLKEKLCSGELIAQIKKTLYQRFDINETVRQYSSGEMFKKVSIISKGTVPVKTTDPRKDTSKYGGMQSSSYCKYCIVEVIDKKQNKVYKLEAIPATNRNNVSDYLKSIYGSQEYRIINDNILTNVIVEEDNKKYSIASRYDEKRYAIQNRKDRNFSYQAISIIKKIEKYNENNRLSIKMEIKPESIEIAKRDEKRNGIVLSISECNLLLEEIKNMYKKDIYNYISIPKVLTLLSNIKQNILIQDLVQIIGELLKLLKTNSKKLPDLKLIGGATNDGKLNISKILKPGMKFISESITGYYRKVIFEVPSGI